MDGNGLDELQAGLPIYEMEMVLERLLKLQFVDVAKECTASPATRAARITTSCAPIWRRRSSAICARAAVAVPAMARRARLRRLRSGLGRRS